MLVVLLALSELDVVLYRLTGPDASREYVESIHCPISFTRTFGPKL